MRRFFYALFALSLPAICSGCVAAAVGVAGAGAGTYAYIKGELQNTYSVPLAESWPKTLQAIQDLKLTIDSKQMDALGGTIEGRRADGTPVTVRLKPNGEHSTLIGVRVGSIDSVWSKSKAKRIHTAIQKRLGVSPG